MFSKACEYAIRAMMFIALKSAKGDKVGIKEVSKGASVPEAFLAKILQDLGRKELVQSAKGPNGGFYLDETLKQITVAEIVRAIDGDQLFTGCGMGLRNCSEKRPCPLHNEFKSIRKKIQLLLESTTISEFNLELAKGVKYLKR
jgi:Rrf2 family protein